MLLTFFRSWILALVLTAGQLVSAQTGRILTMEEAILMSQQDSKKSLRAQSLPQLQWLPGGSKYSYIKPGTPAKLFIVDIETQKTDSSISVEVLNRAIQAFNKNMSLKSFPAMEWIDNDNFRIFKDTQYLNFNLAAQAFRNILSVSAKADHHEYENGKNQVAYVQDDNLYIATPDGVRKLTTDGGKGIVYGQSVHRNEFGISKGLFWSPKGNKLAFYRMDESMVSDYGLYDITKMPAVINNIKYPIAGAKSHHVTLGVYDLQTQKVTYMETGEPKEQYLTNITWDPEGEYVYIAIVNRGQNQCFVNRYDAATGVLDKNLIEERDDKYIEPQYGMMFLPNETNKFIWQSEKDGYNHLYLYNTKGKLISQLTSGTWMVTHLIGIDPRGEFAYFEATKESPIERHIYSVNLNSSEVRKLSQEQGTNTAMFNQQYNHFLNTLSSTTVPRKISLNTHKGEQVKILLNAPNPLEDYQLGETTIFPIRNENTVLYCRMITPPNFDKKNKYPVVVYVYGGPHAQMVNNTWLAGSNLWMQLMAQKGYIVFTLDNRGSSNRGHAFESATHRKLGTLEIEDQIAGVNYLKQFAYVDANRIAVHGWSFGGFMTTSLMTRTPGVFKVGVAGGPVIDWGLYEIMYTERYMDSPEENPEGYKTANLLNYTGSLQDKLLMIHGCDDDVVLWQHSMLYCKTAVNVNNTYLDYFIYPGHKHNVLGKDRVHLMQKITEYIIENL
jgi:dipeptidyl-peptidase-4